MWRTLVLAFSVAVLMTGCSYFRSETPDPNDVPPEPVVEPPVIAAPAPRHKPSPPPAPSPPEPSYDPSKLIGLSEADVSTLFGAPSGKDEQAPARIWRYVADDCVVTLFFYLDLDDEEFHLLTYEANQQKVGETNKPTVGAANQSSTGEKDAGPSNGGANAAQRCFDQVLGQRAQQH
jgi:hypothetical protein